MGDAEWGDCRRQARVLETQLQAKLSQFSKLSIIIHNQQHKQGRSDRTKTADNFADLDETITSLLSQLAKVNERMGICLERSDKVSAVDDSTFRRYRDILRDSSREHTQCKDNIQNILARHALMDGARQGGEESTVRKRTDTLLSNSNSLHSSIRMTQDMIGNGRRTHDTLKSSRSTFGNINNNMHTLKGYHPMIGEVIGKISRSKQRDMIVMSITIACCMFFTLIYWWNK